MYKKACDGTSTSVRCVSNMLPSLANLNIDAPTMRNDQVNPTEKPKRFIQKNPRQKKETLPPGWKAYTNGAGDVQYTDGNKHTYKITDAWDRYNKGGGEDAEDDAEWPVQSCTRTEAYGSISKELHRMRIVEDMVRYVCDYDLSPSLVYIGAPDGSDSQFFQRQVNLRAELEGTRLVAVNTADIAHITDTEQVEYFKGTMENYLSKSAVDEFSHAWLDTTSNEIDNELLWNAQRCTRELVYLVVSLKNNQGRRSRQDSALVTQVQCNFFGLTIKHEEAYAGITPTKKPSPIINMMFTACKVDRAKRRSLFDGHYLSIGGMIDVPTSAVPNPTGEDRGGLFVRRRRKKEDYIALITGWDTASSMWSLHFFNDDGKLFSHTAQAHVWPNDRIYPFTRAYFPKLV